ncbi:MAG: hypothetical protein IPM22_06490 [Betaproteobacteria bacterium]|nr:hypothetical protein [Betaproteobacteria bacterium]
MIRARAVRAAALAAAALVVAGCALRANEDVRASVAGSHLVLENRSHADIHYQLVQGRVAFIPLSTPLNQLADGKTLKLRIAPSQRGETIDLVWWRPGERIDGSEWRGPDRLRRVRVALDELAEPLPNDEAFVRTCVEVAATVAEERRASATSSTRGPAPYFSAAKAESDCLKEVEQWCATAAAPECARELTNQRARLASVQQVLARHREIAVERKAGAVAPAGRDTSSGALEVAGRDAFYDLREGKVDRYLARLCPNARALQSGPFMQGQLRRAGADFAARGVDIQRVAERAADHVTFDALDRATLTARAPGAPVVKVKATFERDGERHCLLEVAELR